MSSTGVIEAVYVLEDSDLDSATGLPGMPPDQFRFDGFKEGFHRGIIIAISLATHPLPGSACLHAREGIL